MPEKNPIYDFLYYKKSDIDGVVLQNNALLYAILELQIKQLAATTGRPEEEVREDARAIIEKIMISNIDNLTKTIK